MKDGGQAFPFIKPVLAKDENGLEIHLGQEYVAGMTLRDYFAGQALVGISQIDDGRVWNEKCGKTYEAWCRNIREMDAKLCYSYADAMIKERGE